MERELVEMSCRAEHVGGVPVKPVPMCAVHVSFPPGHPEAPIVSMPGGVACENAELALAIILTALLRTATP